MMDVKFELTSPAEKVDQKIKVFEQAAISEKIKLKPPTIERIFLAIDSHLDASEISENAMRITLNLALKFQAEVYIACIVPTAEELVDSEKLVNDSIKLFESKNVSVIGGCGIGFPSEHILGLSKDFNPNLLVLPIPYGERAETFEIESLGATVDLVIRKSPFPILLVRKPKFKPSEITKNMLMLLSKKENIEAAEWALTLGERGSKLKLLSIIEKETVEKVQDLAEEISSSEIGKGLLEHSHKKAIQPLINGIIEEAKNREIEVKRIHLVGNRVKLTLEEAKKEHTLIVLSAILVDQKILVSEVENVAKFSKIPILIVKD
jgi:nucleotide-binding universal stress UspA family protein